MVASFQKNFKKIVEKYGWKFIEISKKTFDKYGWKFF